MVLYRLYRIRGGRTTLNGRAQSLVDALHEVTELLQAGFPTPADQLKLSQIRLEIYTEEGKSLCDISPAGSTWWFVHKGGR